MKANQVLENIKNRKISLKSYLVTIALVSMIFLATIAYVYSNAFTAPNIYLDALPSTASYVINTDGTNVWATRYDGKIAFNGTDASTVIQAAINALTAGRTFVEWVYFKGNFAISATILIPSYTGLDLRQARLTLANGANCDMFRNAGYATSNQNTNVHIRSGILDGNRANNNAGSGIKGAFRLHLQDITITNFKEWGMWLVFFDGNNYGRVDARTCRFSDGNQAGGAMLDRAHDSKFTDCYFGNNGNYQVYLDVCALNEFINCHFYSAGQGLGLAMGAYLIGYCTRCKFIGGEFEHIDKEGIVIEATDTVGDGHSNEIIGVSFFDVGKSTHDTYSCILFKTAAEGPKLVEKNTVTACTFFTTEANKYKYCIELQGVGAINRFHIITNNVFGAGAQTVRCLILPNSDSIIQGNIGYRTERSGTATILNGQVSVTFAHGLAGTPTLVTLGATHAEVADAIWSADATNITITVPSAVTANRNISWSAEYKP